MSHNCKFCLVLISLLALSCAGGLGEGIGEDRFGDGSLTGATGRPGSDAVFVGAVGDGGILLDVQAPLCQPTVEQCNGLDDDCDGVSDEGFGIGDQCVVTVEGCPVVGVISCSPQNPNRTQCDAGGVPMEMDEVCNEIDDDCDGLIDEGFPDGCAECVASAEVCNGADDDCDGLIDEGAPAGVNNEACNGLDDDCDGSVDEANACPCKRETTGQNVFLFCGAPAVANEPAFARRRTWPDARQLCQDIGGDLAIIESGNVNAYVYTQLQQNGFGDTWIGLNDRQNEMAWVWLDGVPVAYSNWDSGEPNNSGNNEDCGIFLMSDGRAPNWDDRPCDREYHFICELPQ